jgi:mobilome CxxCx(11)CxxC protein
MSVPQPTEATQDPRAECWEKAHECYGTAKIFQRRLESLGKKLRLLGFVGLAGPLFIGLAVGAFGVKAELLPLLIGVLAVVSIGQGVFSLWALFAQWENGLRFAAESQGDNLRLCREYEELARRASSDLSDRRARLDERFRLREDQDSRQAISDEEMRFAMRATLRQYGKACKGCGEIPVSLKPTECSICGSGK